MAAKDIEEPHDEDLVPVKTPSGGLYWVYGREVKYFTQLVKRYLADNHVTNVSDLQEFDRIVMLETLVWRWLVWESQQKDYWFEAIDEKELQKQIKETSTELRQIKAGLGIDKVTRDKVRGEDSVSKYLANLRIRGKEFGVHRENQSSAAIELMQEFIGRLTVHDNCTEEERRDEHCTAEDVLAWFRDVAIPKFNELDEHFRENSQKYWIREM